MLLKIIFPLVLFVVFFCCRVTITMASPVLNGAVEELMKTEKFLETVNASGIDYTNAQLHIVMSYYILIVHAGSAKQGCCPSISSKSKIAVSGVNAAVTLTVTLGTCASSYRGF